MMQAATRRHLTRLAIGACVVAVSTWFATGWIAKTRAATFLRSLASASLDSVPDVLSATTPFSEQAKNAVQQQLLAKPSGIELLKLKLAESHLDAEVKPDDVARLVGLVPSSVPVDLPAPRHLSSTLELVVPRVEGLVSEIVATIEAADTPNGIKLRAAAAASRLAPQPSLSNDALETLVDAFVRAPQPS